MPRSRYKTGTAIGIGCRFLLCLSPRIPISDYIATKIQLRNNDPCYRINIDLRLIGNNCHRFDCKESESQGGFNVRL